MPRRLVPHIQDILVPALTPFYHRNPQLIRDEAMLDQVRRVITGSSSV